MKDRILELIEALKLSRNDFAVKIGVQRSNITHILDGRNRPSLDFIEKTIKAFPQINVTWLVTGEGNMFKPAVMTSLFDVNETKQELGNNKKDGELKPKAELPELGTTVLPVVNNSKIVEKIVMFYTDKTFDIYTTSN